MKAFRFIFAALILVATNTFAESTITGIATNNPAFSTLATALQATGLDDVLDGDGPFTVFAPTNEAFDNLPEGLLSSLLDDPDALSQVLLYHVVAGTVLSTDLTEGNVTTAQGNDVSVSLEGGVFINTSQVTDADIEASNGVIHVLDEVLIPPTIVQIALGIEGEFETLAAALAAADLVDTLQGLGPFTVFAPTDAAFAALPDGLLDALLADTEALTQVLLYHVVAARTLSTGLEAGNITTLQGNPVSVSLEGGVFINESSQVIDADVQGLNGVIHVIDEVLIPPTIVEIALGIEGEFETLAAALTAADLVDTLQGLGPFTVFAPTDAAFAALPPGLLDALLEDTEALTQVLLYHVVAARALSTDLEAGNITTLQGNPVSVSLDGGVFINESSQVIDADVQGLNGVIHVVDEVLIPPTIVEIALGIEGEFETLAAALTAADLVDTLQGIGPFTVFAPTDAAFADLPDGVLDSLLADPEALARVLLYHVVPGRILSTDLSLGPISTLHGANANISESSGAFFIDDATITTTDIQGLNGVIHVIDSVILPPLQTIAEIVGSDENFSTLATALDAAGLTGTLDGPGPFTVFAPNNDAFAALPPGLLDDLLADPDYLAQVLLYHVLGGRTRSTDLSEGRVITAQGAAADIMLSPARIDGVDITTTDIEADNGVIHVINAVLLPPPTITEIAVGDTEFSTLVTALTTADLADALDGPGPFTVFAPLNSAFDDLPDGVLDDLLANPDILSEILLYHVVRGRVRAADLLPSLGTLQATSLNVDTALNQVNAAGIVAADIEALNGVIHIIDGVLMPIDGFTDRPQAVRSRLADGSLRMVWMQMSGATGTLEFTDDLMSGVWQEVTVDIIDVDGVSVAVIPADLAKGFYRVAF